MAADLDVEAYVGTTVVHNRKEPNEVADNQKTSFALCQWFMMATDVYIRSHMNHNKVFRGSLLSIPAI